MLVVTVELWPFGIKSERKELATMVIANDGTGDVERGNYNVRRFIPGEFAKSYEARKFGEIEANVKDHPRFSSVWLLVRKALEACKV